MSHNPETPFTTLRTHAGLTPDALKVIYGRTSLKGPFAAGFLLVAGILFIIWSVSFANKLP